jgi:hypothetical protein
MVKKVTKTEIVEANNNASYAGGEYKKASGCNDVLRTLRMGNNKAN